MITAVPGNEGDYPTRPPSTIAEEVQPSAMTFQVDTTERVEVRDVTRQVEDALLDAADGTATVFVPHTTAGVTINEAESGLLADLESILAQLVPEDDDYAHDRIDDNSVERRSTSSAASPRNADAHLRAMLVGSSATVPVADGQLDLGTWQSVRFVECDGPRTRRVRVVA